MASEEPPAPARRRFLGRAAAVLGAFGLAGRSDAAGAGTGTTVPAAGGPLFGHHLPDLGDEGPHNPAIQAAINRAAEAGGGVVLLPAGELPIDGSLRLEPQVTLRGTSVQASVLRAVEGLEEPLLVVPEGAEGVAVEALALEGGGLRFEGAASYVVVRRVAIRRAAGDAVLLSGGPYAHLSFEQLSIEEAAGDGVRLAFAACTSVFLSEISIAGFGRGADGAAGLRLGGRCHVSQLYIDPVGAGHTGVLFGRGSNRSTLTNFYVRTQGGTPYTNDAELDIAVGPGAVE